MSKFKVAVIGCGTIGKAHSAAWTRLAANGDVELVGVCDLKEERAKAFAEQFNCQAFTDVSQLPADLNAVSVVTPPFAHYAVTKAALERGYSVFCEKPITMDAAEGEELVAIAEKKGVQLSVGFKMRYEPIFQEAKKLFPEIGTLRAIVTTKQQKFSPRPEAAWVTRTGAMYELSVHDFDLISYITGRKPQQVLAAQLKHLRGWEKEDGFCAIVDYGDGVTATLQGMYCDETIFCFRDLTITLLGEKGYMRIERPDRIVMHTDAYRVVDIPKGTRNTFDVELEHFMNAVLGKEENPLKGKDAVAMTWLIESIRSFDRKRQTIVG